MRYVRVDLGSFASEEHHQMVEELVDNELQKKRIYYHESTHFNVVDLDNATAESQAILQLLADQNCLFSAIKLSITLYESTPGAWPVRSNFLAEQYLFDAFEFWISLEHQALEKDRLAAFKQTHYFKQACFIAYELILRDDECRRFCPEFINFIYDNLNPEGQC